MRYWGRYWYWYGMRAFVAMFFIAGGVAQAAEVSHGDRRFMEQAAQAGALEIQAGRMAERNAEHDEVKRYAREMIEAHSGFEKQLKSLAAGKDVDLPKDLSVSQERTLKTLQGETGARFDLEYADQIAIGAHKDAVDLFMAAAERAQDPEIKAFARQTLPGLKAHLEAGLALRKSLAASGQASPEETQQVPRGGPGSISPASRQAPPTLLPGDKGAPKAQ